MATQAPPATADPRSPELAAAHSTLARQALDAFTAKTREVLQAHPDAAREIQAPQAQYKYDIQINVGGLLYVVVDVPFNGQNIHFFGQGGGLAIGAATTWGTAWLNYPIEQIRNWDARFQMNYWAVATNINWWGMNGAFIGSAAGGGLGLGAGILGGQGTFKPY